MSSGSSGTVEFMGPVDPDVDVERQPMTQDADDEALEPFSFKMPESLQCYAAEAAGMAVMITIGLITNM